MGMQQRAQVPDAAAWKLAQPGQPLGAAGAASSAALPPETYAGMGKVAAKNLLFRGILVNSYQLQQEAEQAQGEAEQERQHAAQAKQQAAQAERARQLAEQQGEQAKQQAAQAKLEAEQQREQAEQLAAQAKQQHDHERRRKNKYKELAALQRSFAEKFAAIAAGRQCGCTVAFGMIKTWERESVFADSAYCGLLAACECLSEHAPHAPWVKSAYCATCHIGKGHVVLQHCAVPSRCYVACCRGP